MEKKIQQLENKDLISLPFKIKKNCLTEDPLFPINNLFEGNNSNDGWISDKFCSYPQKIIIKFEKYVDIKQINIIINETKIPKMIQFINCKEKQNFTKKKYKYENIGYIKLSTNEESNFEKREMRKISINIFRVHRLKILIHENYTNSFNPNNQVGIVSLEILGNYSKEDKNLKDNINNKVINEESIEEEDIEEESNIANENIEEVKEVKNNCNIEKIEKEKVEKKEEKFDKDKEDNNNNQKCKNEFNDIKEKNKEENYKNIENNEFIKDDNTKIKNDIQKEENKKIENIEQNKPTVKIIKKGILKKKINQKIEIDPNNNKKEKINNNINKNIVINKINIKNENTKNYDDNLNNNKINININKNETNVFEEEKKDNNTIENSGKSIEIIISEKIKELNYEMQKINKIKEYNEFIKIQNEINELKNLLNKINNIESQKKKVSINHNKNYFKFKTINQKSINYTNKKISLSPINKVKKNNEDNKNEKSQLKLTKTFKISDNMKTPLNFRNVSNDNLVLLTIKNKNKNNSSHKIFEIENNKNINNLNNDDSLYISEENMEKGDLEELSPEIKEKNIFLINILGEEIIQKIYSKNLYYINEGFNALNSRVKDIIVFNPENAEETNNYIIKLINLFLIFIDNDNPSVIMKSIELFKNIIKAVNEKGLLNKIEYNFKISKSIINKLIEKLNHNSKRIRNKIAELYCKFLDCPFCDYNSLIIELIEKEVNEYFYKLNNLNNNNYTTRINSARNGIGMSKGMNFLKNINQNQTFEKMNIFLKIFQNPEQFKHKLSNKNFPEVIVGDFLIMNINNPNNEIKEITKNVLCKYINIFGNQIFYKLKMIIGNQDLVKIIQDKEELLFGLRKYEEEKSKKEKNTKIFIKSMTLKRNRLEPLSPIKLSINNNYNFSPKFNHKFEKINFGKKPLMRVSSLPKFVNLKKTKLNPINKNNTHEGNIYKEKNL